MRHFMASKRFSIAASVAFLTAALLTFYVRFVRPWHLHWGATDAGVQMPLPGDELIPDARLVATRALTIRAPASAIWPWLVQMGYRRAGWYSYDWLDNDGSHVDRIIPELQALKVGDTLLTSPTGGFRVAALEPERALVLLIRESAEGQRSAISSAMVLQPLDEQHTRLLIRVRAKFTGVRGRLFGLLFDFGDFVMMRKMLLGIRHRVQASVVHQLPL